MGITLNALFLETEKETYFYKYFWDGLDAFNAGETAKELINQNVIGYKVEEHRIFNNFDITDNQQYFQLAKNYESLS